MRQLRRDVMIGQAVEFLDGPTCPLGGKLVPAGTKIVRQRMPRLEQVDESEADPVDRDGARFVEPGKKSARVLKRRGHSWQSRGPIGLEGIQKRKVVGPWLIL